MDVRWLGLVLLVATATGCGSERSTPDEVVPDPRAYVRQGYLASPPTWLGVAYYNLDDPALLDGAIDKAMRLQRRKWNGTLPGSKRELDAFIRNSQGVYTGALFDTPERRAQVEARMRQWFASPKVTRDGDTAVVDLGWAPAAIQRGMRSGWEMASSPEIDRNELRKEHVNRALCLAGTAHPSMEKLEVRVRFRRGSSNKELTYRYRSKTDRVEVRTDEDFVSRAPVGGIPALCRGEAATHTSEMVRARPDAP